MIEQLHSLEDNFLQQSSEFDLTTPKQTVFAVKSSDYPNLLLKLTRSIAETSTGDLEPYSSPQFNHYQEEDSLSISEFALSPESQDENQSYCVAFHDGGYCFKGRQCPYSHSLCRETDSVNHRKGEVLQWILRYTPEILVYKAARLSHFLA